MSEFQSKKVNFYLNNLFFVSGIMLSILFGGRAYSGLLSITKELVDMASQMQMANLNLVPKGHPI